MQYKEIPTSTGNICGNKNSNNVGSELSEGCQSFLLANHGMQRYILKPNLIKSHGQKLTVPVKNTSHF